MALDQRPLGDRSTARRPAPEPVVDAADRLAAALAAAQFELIPLSGALEAAAVLPTGSTVTVTASAIRGLEPTIQLCEALSSAGYAAVPHLAARSVLDGRHLAEVLARLDAASIRRVLVVGGDAHEPGPYPDGLSLLRAMEECGHTFDGVDLPAYPEGHATIPVEALSRALLDKQPYATSMTTQLCFHPDALRRWYPTLRAAGVTLPVYVGIPAPVDLARLARIATRIGIAGASRYLRKQHGLVRSLLGRGGFRPDRLLSGMAATIADPLADVRGLHVFTFNQVADALAWQARTLERLTLR